MNLDDIKKYEPIFGAYHVKKELGSGSFGKVFEIEREDLGVKYTSALKAISIPSSKSEIDMLRATQVDTARYYKSIVSDIQKEIIIMTELKGNSNIVSYENHKFIPHDDGIGWDILIQMELLTPLYSFLADNEFTTNDVVKLGIDICRALELCHKNKILHRDIKPENIFRSPTGAYKLGDFGISKTIESTSTGTKIGTESFMAPEVFNNDEYGFSADLYSLGLVLYMLLNRYRLPFDTEMVGRHSTEARVRRMSGEEIPYPEYGGKDLVDIVLKACKYNPDERFANAIEMRMALQGIGHSDELNDLDSIEDEPIEDEGTVLIDEAVIESDETQLLSDVSDLDDDMERFLASELVVLDKYVPYENITDEEIYSGNVSLSLDELEVQKEHTILLSDSTDDEIDMNRFQKNELTMKSGLQKKENSAFFFRRKGNSIKLIAGLVCAAVALVAGIFIVSDMTGEGHISSVEASSVLVNSSGTVFDEKKICDSDVATTWTEGVEGSGVGEYLNVSLSRNDDMINALSIYNGYQKNDEKFEKNNRVRGIRFIFEDGSTEKARLEDTNGEQVVVFEKTHTGKSFQMVITSVYDGTEYDDTCLSEIQYVDSDINKDAVVINAEATDGSRSFINTAKIKKVKASSTLTSKKGTVYKAENVLDGDCSTCWIEDREGDGVGEYLDIILEDRNSVIEAICIDNGYQKNEEKFYKNNRIEDVEFKFEDGTAENATLEDIMGRQVVVFDDEHETDHFQMIIKSVYDGYQYDDTCISEIRIVDDDYN